MTCDSTTAATLSSTVDDNKAQEGPTNFSVTFDTTAGVVPGTIYECSIKMEKKGFISAKSFPSIIITPDSATGNLTLCMLGNNSCFCCSLIFSKLNLKKNLLGTLSICQMVWTQIRVDVFSFLTWVQSVCKGYQQITKVARQEGKI